jgi:hypothetical protein
MDALNQAKDAIDWADGEKPELDDYFFQKAQAYAAIATAENASASAHAHERMAESLERALPILSRQADALERIADALQNISGAYSIDLPARRSEPPF